MKIVVLDGYTLNPGDNPWDPLAALGDLTVYDRTNPEDVLERSRGAEILITNKTRLNADTLAALPDLRCIGVIATGYDVVDIAAAGKRGIPVMNVVELRHGSRGATCLRPAVGTVPPHACTTRASAPALGRRAGLVFLGYAAGGAFGQGYGHPRFRDHRAPRRRTGARVRHEGDCRFRPQIRRRIVGLFRSRIFPCRICGDGRTVPRFGRAVPALPADGSDPRHRQRRQHRFHEGRGHPPESCARPLLDEAAVAEALASGKLGGLGADVVSVEPIAQDNPLLASPNTLLTPHIAWATRTARQNITRIIAENIAGWMAGQPKSVVNKAYLNG